MRRKIAFGITIGMTVLLSLLQPVFFPALSQVSLFGMKFQSLCILITVLTFVSVLALCTSRKPIAVAPQGKWFSVCGWVSTFAGAVVTLTVLMDLFFFSFKNQPPYPGIVPESNFDYMLLYGTLLFGIGSGLFLVFQGFTWMSSTVFSPTWLRWLSICPVIWMWLRLARYEISYASTLDIDENFTTFASLVFASLFFLQFARAIALPSSPPKKSLLIFGLMTAMVTLSSVPAATFRQTTEEPLSTMLNIIVDMAIGLTALSFAAMQTFCAAAEPEEKPEEKPEEEALSDEEHVLPDETDSAEEAKAEDPREAVEDSSSATAQLEDDNGFSWELPKKQHAPLDPPFSMDQKLPIITAANVVPARYPKPKKAAPAPAAEAPAEPAPVATPVTVDELLNELENFQ